MAISLLNSSQQVTAKIQEPQGVFGVTPDQAAAIQKVIVDWLDKRHKKKLRQTGYTTKQELDLYNAQSVAIPANFAGLEAVAVPTRLEYQFFVISSVSEEDDGVVITAQHVFYENLTNYTNWEPTKDADYTGAAACRNVLNNAVSPEARFSVASDCTDTKKGSELDYTRKNIVQAFLDPEKGICKLYGLSLIRDNWDFYCLKNVGYDRGFVVEDGKNLLGVTRSVSIENTRTRIAPIAKDAKGNVLWLTGTRYIDSPHIGNYSSPRVEIYDTGLQIGKNGVTSENIEQKMRQEAQKLFDEQHIDDPEVSMTIDFLSIGDTEEYAQYRDLDKVYLYDILTIKDKKRGYNYSAQVIGIEHDILTGRMLSVTIGSLNDWDGVRKIASWQVPEVDGGNIRLHSILAGTLDDDSVTTEALQPGSVTITRIAAAAIETLYAGSIQAVKADIANLTTSQLRADIAAIGKAQITTANIIDANIKWANIDSLVTSTASIASGVVQEADIGYAQIKDASIVNLIARDAVTDRYFIDKLAVRSAQMVQATVGELVIKAANGNYYRLDVAADGSVSPTQVTLTASEIAAGETSNGHGAIIETDLTVAELSASNMKAINALIDKITADRIDVNKLFAREATINKLNTIDISSNQYLRLMAKRTFSQWNDPASDPLISFVQDGDVWDKNNHVHTWNDIEGLTWNALTSGGGMYAWMNIGGWNQYVRVDGEWLPMTQNQQMHETQAQMLIEQEKIHIRVDSHESDIANLSSRVTTVETTYSEDGIRDIITSEFTTQIDELIDEAAGEAIEKLLDTRLAFLQWEEPVGTQDDPLIDGMVWSKDHGYRAWDDIVSVNWDAMAGYTWDSFSGPQFYIYKGGEWTIVCDYGLQISETVRLDRTVEGVSANTERVIQIGDTVSQLNAEFEVGFGEITARVTQVESDVDSKYTIQSGIDIVAAGIEISGGKYIKIKSGGLFTVESENFVIDGSGNVSLTGAITSQSGTIGGWTLGANKLSSGSSTNYVHIASSGTYAFLAGNSTEASAPFRVKRDGTVYLTKLIALDENNQETNVNLRTAGLWKLSGANLKDASISGNTLTLERYTGGNVTVNFNTAASVTMEGSWSGRTFTVTNSGNANTVSTTVTFADSASGAGNFQTKTINTFTNHKGHVNISLSTEGGTSPGLAWIVAADATSEYNAGVTAGTTAGHTAGWQDAFAMVEQPSSGYGTYFTVKVPATNEGTQSTMIFTLTKGTPSASGGYASVSRLGSTVARIALDDWWEGGRASVTIPSDGITYYQDSIYSHITHNTIIYIQAKADNDAILQKPLVISGADAYSEGWSDARAKVVIPSAGTGTSFTVKVPSATEGQQQTLTFTVTKGTPSASGGYAAVSHNGSVVGRVSLDDWWAAGYAAGWAAAKAAISRTNGSIYGPSDTVDNTELLFEVTAGGSISSITNPVAKTYVANGRAIALVNNVSVDEKLLSKTQVFN